MIEKYKKSLVNEDGVSIDSNVFDSFLKDNGIQKPKIILRTEDITKHKVQNILGESSISSLMILLVNYGLIKLSDNTGNNFEKEKEIKILDVDKKGLGKELANKWGALKTFEGKVTDMYYDTEAKDLEKGTNNNGEKSSLRIRHKVPKGEEYGVHYCTIKKKDKKSEDQNELRDCYEEEFVLFNSIIFYKLLKIIGLNEYKIKVKNRVAYSLGSIKFDFDKYEGIPNLLEIEAQNSEIAQNYINHLGLSDYKKLNGGTSSLFKYYGKELKKFY